MNLKNKRHLSVDSAKKNFEEIMESDPPLSKGQKVFASMLPLSRNTVHRWMLKLSEYGVRQIAAHNNRNLSMRKFRELICPCMTLAKQRDTADEIIRLTIDISFVGSILC